MVSGDLFSIKEESSLTKPTESLSLISDRLFPFQRDNGLIGLPLSSHPPRLEGVGERVAFSRFDGLFFSS